MSVEKRILEEIKRYRQINKYIVEQELGAETPDTGLDAAATPDLAAPDAGLDTPAPDAGAEATPIDTATDPDVEKVGEPETTDVTDTTETTDSGTEELDITDLVTKQDDILSKQSEMNDAIINQLNSLQDKLGEIDKIFQKVDSLETKFEKYRQKTPEEKLQLRSLDSYPYSQKLTDFFDVKQDEMEASGKNEYVLTDDEVTNYDASTIKGSFNTYDESLPLNRY
jgi:hypothetical protein